jgi:3-oxoacyl-[acyl-carrier protein] reductase
MWIDLTGKRAVVTGGTRGIGAAIALGLARAGATVAVSGRNPEHHERLLAVEPDLASRLRPFTVDMADLQQVDEFITSVEADIGAPDILVNNVGASPSRNFLRTSSDEWSELFRLNLLAAMHCTRRVLPSMRQQRWGRVVMVASLAAKYPEVVLIDYAASKAAMIAAGKALARKYAGDNVLINSILPGLIHTPMWDRAAGEIATAKHSTPDEVFTDISRRVPLGRYGTAEEVADLALFLCSEHANYIAGASVVIDGGLGEAVM